MKEKIFAAFLLLVGLSAVAGGYGLIFMNGLGMSSSYINKWPFYGSFLGPGLILGVIVGGTNLFASFLIFIKNKVARESALVAGFGMIIFEFFEVYITKESHWLQIFYFLVGITTVVLSELILRKTVTNPKL
jgi:hypothetical protein